MAAKKSSRPLTGADILDLMKQPAQADTTISDIVVDTLSDSIDSTVTLVSRLGGAALESGHNAKQHFTLERSVQRIKSQERLRKAADRAAARINAALAQ